MYNVFIMYIYIFNIQLYVTVSIQYTYYMNFNIFKSA